MKLLTDEQKSILIEALDFYARHHQDALSLRRIARDVSSACAIRKIRQGGRMISFRDAQIEAVAELRSDSRSSASLVARRDLERYYTLIAHAENELQLSLSELKCIYDICNGTMFEPALLEPMITAEVEDAFSHADYAQKWSIDAQQLIAKLRSLTPLQSWALVTKIERFWTKSGGNENE